MKLICYRFDRLFPIVFLMLTSLSSTVAAETLRVAVASNFVETAQLLANEFESTNAHKIKISSGSSGKLFHQVLNGAPYDLLLSADSTKPQALIDQGIGIASNRKTYALGKLSLWFKHCPESLHPEALQSPTIKKLAIANPKLAPYGWASKQWLKNNAIFASIENKLVFPENISQTAQLAKLGVVDAALIADSYRHKLLPGSNEPQQSCAMSLEQKDYPEIAQDLIIIERSKHRPIAKEFVRFITSAKGQTLIKNMGYLVP